MLIKKLDQEFFQDYTKETCSSNFKFIPKQISVKVLAEIDRTGFHFSVCNCAKS